MKKILLPLFIILSFLAFWGCSDSVSDLNTKDVSLFIDSADLNIRNNFSHPIYYFAVESGVAAQINWAPISTEENRVKARGMKSLPLDSINAYDHGDEIIFYYWSKKEPGNDNIKYQRVKAE
jgi:hypothetical protein